MLVPVPDYPCAVHQLAPSPVPGWEVYCVICGRHWHGCVRQTAAGRDGRARQRAEALIRLARR